MHRALPIQIALIALFLTACSTGTSPNGSALDGPTTTVSLATTESGIGALGVPFESGQPVVTSVDVAIIAYVHDSTVPMTFRLENGVYTYDPDGPLTSLEFAFTGSAVVTLPAGFEYGFASRGDDADDVWVAYGETRSFVHVSTTGVALALQTLIDAATLAPVPFIDAIAASQSVDLLLTVTAPGGYAVPTADYAVEYWIESVGGSVTATSKLGAQVLAPADPGGNDFTVNARVTGWSLIAGAPVWTNGFNGVVTEFTVPFTIPTGLGFDATAPVATIDAPISGNVGSPLTLSGTATDTAALERVQVYAGPVLIASTDLDEVGTGVTSLQLLADAWSFDWTPSDARAHTFTAVAIDTSGNEHRASATVDVGEAEPTVVTFVSNTSGSATVAAGETVVLTGPAFVGFDPDLTRFALAASPQWGDRVSFSSVGMEVVDGAWTLLWTAPLGAGVYQIVYEYVDRWDLSADVIFTVE